MVADDMTRRVLEIRLQPLVERPEDRDDFRQPDLLKHVRQNRGPLLAASLTVIRGFVAAGRPDQRLPSWGGFEAWSALIRNMVVWAGKQACVHLPDPAETRFSLRHGGNLDAEAMPALYDAVGQLDTGGGGVTAEDLLNAARNAGGDPVLRALNQALRVLCPTPVLRATPDGEPDYLPTPRSLGNKLSHLKGRVVAGRMLERVETERRLSRWRVVAVQV
jgi:hypothetical protein